ncbi:unnamed protein product [Arabis nemorensis]|uniref:Uncharacterized protein n=1 Tax=Arabis nemorensis TaxID=586526 RepID=A0A565BBH8_9BRAS|nr:unnamed protein product [Arabis nemorensis]
MAELRCIFQTDTLRSTDRSFSSSTVVIPIELKVQPSEPPDPPDPSDPPLWVVVYPPPDLLGPPPPSSPILRWSHPYVQILVLPLALAPAKYQKIKLPFISSSAKICCAADVGTILT